MNITGGVGRYYSQYVWGKNKREQRQTTQSGYQVLCIISPLTRYPERTIKIDCSTVQIRLIEIS